VNRLLGFSASILLCAATLLFALSMAVGLPPLSHLSSLVLSWSFVVVVSAMVVQVPAERRAAAIAALAFAVLYAGFASAVYFAQLTTVLQGSAAAEILEALSFSKLGSLMFNFDLLCYAFMAASTFFVGLTMAPRDRAARWLKALLLIHGVFAPVCVLLPILNVFGSMAGGAGDSIGVVVLFAWCLYFTPVAVLAAWRFRAGAGPVAVGDA
jgi:hypothetical protein